MIIWRISLLASPRTDSSAWMCSSLRKHNRNAAMINDTNHESTYRNVGAAGEAEPCVPDIGIFGHQGGDFQEKQCGVSQLEHLGNGRNSTTQPICVFPLHTHTHTHPHTQEKSCLPHHSDLLLSSSCICGLTAESFLNRNLN